MNRNSMLYWFPFVQRSGITHPRTEIVPVDPSAMWCLLDGRDGFSDETKATLLAAGRRIGYPLFLRTDQLAGKHLWRESCYVPGEDVLFQHIWALAESHGMVWASRTRGHGFRVLGVESSFTAFQACRWPGSAATSSRTTRSSAITRTGRRALLRRGGTTRPCRLTGGCAWPA
jgi:hypothetical protein